MSGWLLPAGAALWLGILTSISPCPRASNIAAISFIARKVGNTRKVLLSGLLYAIGRTIAYLALGTLIMAGLMASGEIARFLQRHLNQLLGPILILGGMLLLGLFHPTKSVHLAGEGIQRRAAHSPETGSPIYPRVFGIPGLRVVHNRMRAYQQVLNLCGVEYAEYVSVIGIRRHLAP